MSAVWCTDDGLLPLSTHLNTKGLQILSSHFLPKTSLMPLTGCNPTFSILPLHMTSILPLALHHFLMNIMIIYTCDKDDFFK